MLIILAVISGSRVTNNRSTPRFAEYAHVIEIPFQDLEDRSGIIHSFEVGKPTVYDFAYALNTESETRLQLVNTSGARFAYRDSNALTMYEGSDSLSNALFTGFILEEGHYQIELETSSKRGSLKMGINTREPDSSYFTYLEILGAIQDGTFTADTYREEGYTLVYQGPLTDVQGQTIVSIGPGNRFRVSVFVTGDYEQLSVEYHYDNNSLDVLKNMNATIGFGLPRSVSSGQLRLSTSKALGEIFVFLFSQ